MPSLQINDKFANRYQLKKLIGVGGYSQVWLAEDTKAGNLEVALKIFAPEKGLDSKGLEVFSKEYSLVFNLNQKNLLVPKHFDEFENSPYLVLLYCRQGSVFGKIGEVTEQEFALFMQQACSALKYLHNQDPPIIHQDIKPDNFLIDNQDNYLLADFGISSKIRRTLTKSMGAQASTGTMAYMPPEKFSADKQIIKAGDIFSLGVTMYELLTGDLPFGDNGGLTLKAGAEVPNLPENFSPELNRLLIRCMAKEPWERPTAEQLEETATKFLQTGRWPSVGKDAPETVQEPHKEHEQPRAGRKTETIQQQPDPQPQIISQTDPDKKKIFLPEIILVAAVLLVVAVLVIVVAIISPKGPNAHQKEMSRLADSIRIADRLAVVQAEQNRIADSIAAIQRKVMAMVQTERQRITDSIVAVHNSRIEKVQKKQHPIVDNTTSVQNNRLQIGDHYAGGIIFFLDNTGKHGKVCSAIDQSEKSTWKEAKSICNNLNLNGYTDWHLPSKIELNVMYENVNRNGLGFFGNAAFWSSSETSVGYAWFQYFGNGHQYNAHKEGVNYVRAVRTF